MCSGRSERRTGVTVVDVSRPAAPLDPDALAAGVLAGERAAIGRAITLVESTNPGHRAAAGELLAALLPHSGKSHRIGISGVPGAGKSTFLDAIGMRLIDTGHRVAVLAVDPSSQRTGGSILGDKTRMARLAAADAAFIRPSPNAGLLGGVAAATREAIIVVEAAGYDIVFVETVGVGQSETLVAEMVDTFLLLSLARTGDSLQGIKKGVLELADVIAVNKADGDHVRAAAAAASELAAALRLVAADDAHWTTPVLSCSAVTGDGLDDVWRQLVAHRHHLERTGQFWATRDDQNVAWMWSQVERRLVARFRADPAVQRAAASIEGAVRSGALAPGVAADQLLANGR